MKKPVLRKREEAGQALPLLLIFLVLIFGTSVAGLTIVHNALVDQAEAQTAADAAALAGAQAGEYAAHSAATANGARMIKFENVAGDAVVTAQVGSSHANARAHRSSIR